MRRILIVTVAAIILLCSTTNITAQASSILQTRSFRTNLVKGEYVDDEAVEIEESVDDEPIDVAVEIITDRAEIVESEPQEPNEHTDVSTPADIEPVVDDGELDQLEEPTQSQLDVPEYIGDSTEPEVDTPIDSEETEEKHETEVQGS